MLLYNVSTVARDKSMNPFEQMGKMIGRERVTVILNHSFHHLQLGQEEYKK